MPLKALIANSFGSLQQDLSKLNQGMKNLMTHFSLNSIYQKASAFATGAVLSGIVINAHAANAVSLYTITDITPNNLNSTAVDINNLDQVIVRADGSSFVWENGSMEELATLPGYTRFSPSSINDAGQIVGSAYTPLNDSSAILWQNDTIIDIGPPFPGPGLGTPQHIMPVQHQRDCL